LYLRVASQGGGANAFLRCSTTLHAPRNAAERRQNRDQPVPGHPIVAEQLDQRAAGELLLHDVGRQQHDAAVVQRDRAHDQAIAGTEGRLYRYRELPVEPSKIQLSPLVRNE
jgi:hypothetical protein